VTLRLDGHRTVIVGGAGAIGGAISHAFADAGASVLVLDADGHAAVELARALPGSGHEADLLDVTQPSAVDAAAAAAGDVDSLVYCAGVAFTANLAVTDWSDYRRLMAVNLDGAFYAGSAFARRMLERGGGGSFVFLASTAGLRGEAGASAYCASKFGLIGLTESLAAELTQANIRVNAVAPGNVDSPLLRAVAANQAAREGTTEDEMLDRYAHAGSACRLVTTAEVAATVVWLASPLASGVTGEVVRIDSGQMVG
jgi:NAD(P)-dependent dehydrogenase (short-subunit alcohol dehydrogenase family)